MTNENKPELDKESNVSTATNVKPLKDISLEDISEAMKKLFELPDVREEEKMLGLRAAAIKFLQPESYRKMSDEDKVLIENAIERATYIIRQERFKIIRIDRKSYDNMRQAVVDENPTAKTIKQKPIEVELLLKKPDLLGDSKWQFVYNKTIEAKIEDEDFLDKIRRGKISVRAGVKIPCLMEVEYDLSDRLDIIQKSEKYNIKKIIGDIIEPEEDSQQSLFGDDDYK